MHILCVITRTQLKVILILQVNIFLIDWLKILQVFAYSAKTFQDGLSRHLSISCVKRTVCHHRLNIELFGIPYKLIGSTYTWLRPESTTTRSLTITSRRSLRLLELCLLNICDGLDITFLKDRFYCRDIRCTK